MIWKEMKPVQNMHLLFQSTRLLTCSLERIVQPDIWNNRDALLG